MAEWKRVKAAHGDDLNTPQEFDTLLLPKNQTPPRQVARSNLQF